MKKIIFIALLSTVLIGCSKPIPNPTLDDVVARIKQKHTAMVRGDVDQGTEKLDKCSRIDNKTQMCDYSYDATVRINGVHIDTYRAKRTEKFTYTQSGWMVI